jgi:hypothetical protein
MEQLNYHKLVNLRKRLEKYDCDYSDKILETIDECIATAKVESKQKDIERRSDYQNTKVCCEICGKELLRANLYKHKKNTHK